MKRCPQCRRDYNDDSLSFCLDDGSELLFGPASLDEPPTAILGATIVPPSVGAAPEAATHPQTTSPESSNSIVVLPFANISADDENEYFCDGLAEELLNALSKIHELKVAARTSAFSFKGKNAEAREIGKTLNVKTVLEGSVRKAGVRIRINVQLVNAADGYQLWSERYDREMKDIFDVQDEITLAVVDALKVKLLGEQKAALLKHHTRNPDALDAYLQGVSYFTKFTPEFFLKAIDRYEAAIAIDRNYAEAYAGLAECYSELSFFGPHGEWMPKAKEAARKALELDNDLAGAHNSLAITTMYYDLDFVAAENEFKRALELEPRSAHIQMWYAWFLGLTRRFHEGLERMKYARELDPLSPLIAFGIGAISLWSGENERAIEHLTRVAELSPEFPLAYSYLAEAYIEKGDIAAAVSTVENAQALLDDPISLSAVAYIYAKANERDKAIEVINELEASNRADGVEVQMAMAYVGLGDQERAFELLENARERKSVWLTWMSVEPAFHPLRSNPRFRGMLERIGLPE